MNQYANIRWNNEFSSIFSMTNGVRQGAILSGFAYCFYMNDLFSKLRRNKSGCWVRGTFLGILGYSDDSLLLAPSPDALQELLEVCEDYASSHNLRFSTDKILPNVRPSAWRFSVKTAHSPLSNCVVTHYPGYLVYTGKHLGMTLDCDLDGMKTDIKIKRANYISKNNDIFRQK